MQQISHDCSHHGKRFIRQSQPLSNRRVVVEEPNHEGMRIGIGFVLPGQLDECRAKSVDSASSAQRITVALAFMKPT